jgi:steroid delta-isomerase-like uncharacterized protein
MSTEQNKATIRRYYEEVFNQGDIGLLEELAVAPYVEHNPLPGQASGLEGLRQRVEMLRAAFRPQFTVEDIIADGDKVVVRWTHRGTHVGGFMGIPPTGKPFTITGIDIHGLRNGRMAEHWDVVDQLSLLQQLGLIPQPEQSRA